MKNTRLAVSIFFAAFLCGGFAGRGEDAKVLEVVVPGASKMKVTVPPGWVKEADQANLGEDHPGLGGGFVTLRFHAAAEAKGAFTLAVSFVPDPEGKLVTQQAVADTVNKMNNQYLAGSVEQRIGATVMKSKSGQGIYSLFTDAALAGQAAVPAGQYKVVVSGLFVEKGVALAFTLLVNDAKAPEVEQALKFIEEGIEAE